MDALVPLIVAVTGLPALGIAAGPAPADHAHGRGTALRWALIAVSILAGAVGLYFATGRQAAQVAVVVAMVVAVNALAVSMVLHLRRGGTRR